MMKSATSQLGSYLRRYAGAIRPVRYSDLSRLQSAPYASVAYGAAGTAHALVRLAEASRMNDGRRLATRWLQDALADRTHAARIFDGARVMPTSSFVYGRAGVHAMIAMLYSERDSRGRQGALEGFVRAIRTGKTVGSVDGAAGQLVGVRILSGRIRDGVLRRVGTEVAGNLLDRTRERMRRRWRAADASGFLHAWPGVLFALLSWHAMNGDPPETWLVDGLMRLARIWRADAGVMVELRGSWCVGAAGVALFWCKAFESTGEKAFLDVARDAARASIHYMPTRTHLCCGKAGVAYALLALERVDPGRGWRERALEIGLRAIATPMLSRWPNGLLWGHPGLVCLALDLMSDEPRGFPCIEA
jgi:lantibiotic modifying enzyme